ncbi:Fibrinogen-like protein A [Holothuria leucospilota]|uniref:Fibrinogen-like protein A n=1 Tax=Holothuria leucospilota TaxID=206669 RepID=A0A9Q1BW61_HOLLE|nr:Fibrinogen-like protein A [Holothuria leucospilota]
MVSVRHFSFYLFYILTGFFAFLQQTDGNEVTSSSTGTTTDKTYFFYKLTAYPRDCQEVLDQCPGRNLSGAFVIKPDGYPHPFEVYCNNSFDSGGWTVFMRRFDGSLVFSRKWNEYKKGFGYLSSEFWLGNEKLAFLTNQKRYELRIDVIFSNGSRAFVKHSYFRIRDEWSNYALSSTGNTTGNTGPWAPTCPTNMIYRNCTCERTCEAPTICQNNCQEIRGCICPNGFFLNGSDCVTPEECQCYSSSAGKVIPAGQSFINNQCSEVCTCNGNGLTCNNYNCDTNARCRTTREGGRCECNRGFLGDGLDCECNTQGYLVDGSRCRRPRDCDEVPSVAGYSGSGRYYILPSTWRAFWVYCNMSEGRWTVGNCYNFY